MSTVLDRIAERLKAGKSFPCGLTLRVGEISLRVESNSTELIELLDRYFTGLTAPPGNEALTFTVIESDDPSLDVIYSPWRREPGKSGPKEEFADVEGGRIVRKVRTGMQFLIGSTLRLAVGQCLENYNQVVNFINAQIIAHYLDRDWQLCHAAGVVYQGNGLALAASSGAGKSTLALHLMSRGLEFTSNDRLLVKNTPEGPLMAGIPKLPRVNPGTLLNNPDLEGVLPKERESDLEKLDLPALWALEEKYDVDIASVFGPNRVRLLAPLKTLLILTWSYKGTEAPRFTRVDLRERRDLLDLVMKPAGPFYPERQVELSGEETLKPELYLAALQRVQVFELSGKSDFQFAADYSLKHLF
jgi:HprK-related kinase B